MKRITIILAALVAIALAADADAHRGRGRKARAALVTTTTLAPVTTTTLSYCDRVCQPSEWTPIAGTACDFVRAICLTDDGTGQPNCAWRTKSCD